ncbi:homeobox and leucine zipper encoding b [Hippoglossus stenolepis]|uniref:homeobox and leucine zipper encoding b n=1 Tax=Hippoglossus stenolepis TaxID=195615 RepID=UPI001FAF4EEE|nr:homeobox and leucine zipper encoding b [Hippoglossus stenolepis]
MEGGLPGLGQNTPDACGETQESKVAPAAFNMNQNRAVVLPLLSENQMFLWVHLNQIDLQLDGVAELNKAFDGFPYLTQKQTAVLAQRCSLQPDQVKVWFMVQRLRYGISWDYEDIQEVQRKFMSGQGKIRGKKELRTQTTQNRMREEVKEETSEKKEQKRGVKESGRKKAGKVTESSKLGRNGSIERLEGKMMQELPENKEEDSEVETLVEVRENTQKRRKRHAVPNKIEKTMEEDDGVVERAREGKSETKSLTREKRATLRLAFSNCQYPNRSDYEHLVRSIGIPWPTLVQWFSDTRYYMKRGKPRWMKQEQHSQALANIRYRQCLKVLAKEQLSKVKQLRRGSLRGSSKCAFRSEMMPPPLQPKQQEKERRR